VSPELARAMWAGDVDRLDELAPCQCCCHDHTSRGCPARIWGGCRGQGSEEQDPAEWAAFYARERGMSPETFYGFDLTDSNPNPNPKDNVP